MAACFRAHFRPDPRHDELGRVDPLCSLQMKGYASIDPATTQQRCLHPSFFRTMFHRSTTPIQIAISRVVMSAYFYAMRSCEFSCVSGERRTEIVELQDIHFARRDNSTVHQTSDKIIGAYSVGIEFTNQKNQVKDQRTTNMNAGDTVMNPVHQLGAIVRALRSHPDTTDHTLICTCIDSSNNLQTFSQQDVLDHLRRTAAAIGEDVLGFGPNEIGTKSMRSSAAMGWFLAGVPEPMIKLMGRWLSDAWSSYIRKQVLEFSRGMSHSLLQNEFLHALPSLTWDQDSQGRRRPGSSFR